MSVTMYTNLCTSERDRIWGYRGRKRAREMEMEIEIMIKKQGE